MTGMHISRVLPSHDLHIMDGLMVMLLLTVSQRLRVKEEASFLISLDHATQEKGKFLKLLRLDGMSLCLQFHFS